MTAVNDCGYEIDEAEVIYWGRCPDCVAAIRRVAEAPDERMLRYERTSMPRSDATSASKNTIITTKQ